MARAVSIAPVIIDQQAAADRFLFNAQPLSDISADPNGDGLFDAGDYVPLASTRR